MAKLISFITLVLLCLVLANIAAEPPPRLSKHPVILVISYDGFRHDYLDLVPIPNLNRLKSRGVSVPYLQNQFITTTTPNHHSIATGLYIESHGVTGNYLYDPLWQRVLGPSDSEFWSYSPHILPLWTLNELSGEGRASGVMMWPGSDQAFGPNMTTPTFYKAMNSSYPYQDRIDDVISWITDPHGPANLVFMHFEDPDYTAHEHGATGKRTLDLIHRMDQLAGYMFAQTDRLNVTQRVNFIFLSDHGMTNVRPDGEIELESILDNRDHRKYTNYGCRSVLQLMPTLQNETMEIYEAFKAASIRGNFSVYLRDDLPGQKPYWHYASCRRIMPIIVVAHPGYIFDLPKAPGLTFRGMHGYDSSHLEMQPFFVAAGPIFNVNQVSEPFENVDIFPLVCHVLNISAPPHNGSLARVLPLLK